jgi:hypothetical protein
MGLGGNAGSANAASNSSSGFGTGGSSNAATAAGGNGQAAASAGGSSAAPPSGCAAPGACTGNGIPIGRGLVILPDASGFVRGETNGLGIQGAIYTASDLNNAGGRGNTVISIDFGSGGEVCVSGVVGQILPDAQGVADYARYWGAIIGLTLAREPGAEYNALPWSPASPAGSVIGFRFTLTGSAVPPAGALRFSALATEAAGPEYCTLLAPASGVPSTVAFSALRLECYATNAVPMPANTTLQALHWNLNSNVNGPVPFDFCISDLTAVVP